MLTNFQTKQNNILPAKQHTQLSVSLWSTVVQLYCSLSWGLVGEAWSRSALALIGYPPHKYCNGGKKIGMKSMKIISEQG